MFSFAGKRALVTGAASGIGAECVRTLTKLGADVVGLDSSSGEGHLRCDVSQESEVEAAVADATETLGGLDVLVCAAGVGGPGAVTDISDEEWDRVMRVNVAGVFLASKHSIPHLADGGGSVVTVSSQLGLVAGPNNASYCAAKAAVIHLTKAMAVDHASQGIRANVVCPGPVDTPMMQAFVETQPDSDEFHERLREQLLTESIGKPSDVANAVAYLASDAAPFVTGSVLVVDGGFVVR